MGDEVTEHLPECREPLCDWSDPDSWECLGYGDCDHICICPELRACEQRVRQGMESLAHLYEQDAYMRGWGEAISAAESEVLSFLLDEETRMPVNWMVRHIASTVSGLTEGK